MAIEIKDSKYCVIHSWIEKDNRVIDVTNFANSIFKFWPNISKKIMMIFILYLLNLNTFHIIIYQTENLQKYVRN